MFNREIWIEEDCVHTHSTNCDACPYVVYDRDGSRKCEKELYEKCSGGRLSPSQICKLICESKDPAAKTRTYIIMGRNGPTGKTRLCQELRKRGYTAFELAENTYDLIEYKDDENYYRVCGDHAIIVLNQILPRFQTVKGE